MWYLLHSVHVYHLVVLCTLNTFSFVNYTSVTLGKKPKYVKESHPTMTFTYIYIFSFFFSVLPQVACSISKTRLKKTKTFRDFDWSCFKSTVCRWENWCLYHCFEGLFLNPLSLFSNCCVPFSIILSVHCHIF